MKKLHTFILASYIRPFTTSFLTVLFILVLQFISKYKDDLFGKGFGFEVLAKIFTYASAQLVVLALPLAVLLSSLMTMGTMGEKYELAAIKSSGISLFRVLMPMIAFTILVTAFSFSFSFYIVPKSNLKLYSLLYDAKKAKPSFDLQAGHFYSGIDGYTMRVGKNDKMSGWLYGIMIYDHTRQQGNNKVVLADSGKIFLNEETDIMYMAMYDGVSHESYVDDGNESFRHGRYYFDTLIFRFDLSGFGLHRSNESDFSGHAFMLDLGQLQHSIDSVDTLWHEQRDRLATYISPLVKADSAMVALEPPPLPPIPSTGILTFFDDRKSLPIIMKSIHDAERILDITRRTVRGLEIQREEIRSFQIEYHGKFSMPIACMVFLLIGAPLGAIIRKGGLGMPVLISIVFFIVYYVLMVQGKKFAKEDIMPVWTGVWLPILVLTPISIFLTYESTTDSRLMQSAFWYKIARPFIMLFHWIKMKFGKKSKLTDRPSLTLEALITDIDKELGLPSKELNQDSPDDEQGPSPNL